MGNSSTRKNIADAADDESSESQETTSGCFGGKRKKKPAATLPPVVTPTLVSLAVNGATADGAGGYWAVVNAIAHVDVVATTQPADDNGEWAQIAWTGNGITQDPPNTRRVLCGMARTVTVTATLNGPPQSVTIEIYDLASIASNLRINRPGNVWKDYAGFMPANTGIVSATTTPANNTVWGLLAWPLGGGAAGAALNQQNYNTAAAGDINMQVTLGAKQINGTLHICQWPVLAVDDITFSGGTTVNNDTVANFDNHWRSGRAVANRDPSPLCFRRNRAITLTVTLRVTTPPTEAETVTVRGTATAGINNIVWTSGPIAVNPADATVSFPAAVAGSAPLPDQVDFYNPLTITWEMSDPNGGWIPLGPTEHLIYATLGTPAGTPAYWTLLHYSCTPGAASDQAVITGAFNAIRGRNVTRKRDNVPLTYWTPGRPANDPAAGMGNTTALLGHATGAGHCGSWSEFLIDMFKLHGVTTGHKVNVTREAQVAQRQHPLPPRIVPAATPAGFLVATWNFAGPATNPNMLTHSQWGNCTEGPPAPGQNNAGPPPSFYNHFVVFCATDNRIYDPSYGNDFASPAAWEPASISGLFSDVVPGFNAGYSPVGGTRLLQFRDRVTNANL
jgi:hypothetical protein